MFRTVGHPSAFWLLLCSRKTSNTEEEKKTSGSIDLYKKYLVTITSMIIVYDNCWMIGSEKDLNSVRNWWAQRMERIYRVYFYMTCSRCKSWKAVRSTENGFDLLLIRRHATDVLIYGWVADKDRRVRTFECILI